MATGHLSNNIPSLFNKKFSIDSNVVLKPSEHSSTNSSPSLAATSLPRPTMSSASAIDLIASSSSSASTTITMPTAKFTARNKLNKSPSDDSLRSLPSSTSGRLPSFLGSVVDSVVSSRAASLLLSAPDQKSNKDNPKPQSASTATATALRTQLQPQGHLGSNSFSNLHWPASAGGSASAAHLHESSAGLQLQSSTLSLLQPNSRSTLGTNSAAAGLHTQQSSGVSGPPHQLTGSSSLGAGLVSGDRLIAGLANPSAASTATTASGSTSSGGSTDSLSAKAENKEKKADNIGKQGAAQPLPTSKSLSAALAAKSAEAVRGSTFATAPIEAPLVGVMPSINGQTPGLEGFSKGSSGSTSSAASSSSTSHNLNGQQHNKGYRPDEALQTFGSKLTSYEHTEIYNYQRVYFVGSQAKKRICVAGGSNNSNFDDENGSYLLVPHDHVAYRYEILKVIGKGSFGQVIKAYDHKHQQYVALKLVRNEKRFHRQAEEEIRILDHLRRQDTEGTYNVIHMLDNFNFRNHKCITFELMSINLYELIKKNKFQGFNLALVRKFAYSMLQCLELLNRNHLIHCDLKPENVLLKTPNRSSIKVIDFGSSCFDDQRIYTYIQSRFYRAPEVIMGSKYGMPIDMWSLGCILAELLTGYPLLPGEDENDQLALIVELLGMPAQKILDGAKRQRNFFSSKGHPRYCQVTQLMDGTTVLTGGRSKRGKLRGPPGSRSLQSALKNQGDDLFLDFLRRCLDWDPETRITPQQALKHTWLRRRLPRPPATGQLDSTDSMLPAGIIK
ncbi:protein kinase domain-containing protein [Ditylenchus destructor]|nr:protein kinase domain-containing protein [Ditylenchus destructor]